MKLIPRGGAGAMFPLVVMLLLAMLTLWLAKTIGIEGWIESPQPSRDPDYIVERFALTRLSETGVPRYVLTSEKMVHFPGDDSSHLTRPVLRQAQQDKPELFIRADRGVITAGGDVAHMHDNVEILRAADTRGPATRSSGQLRVTTSYLRVLPDADLADTPAPVRIEQAGSVLTGIGMEFDNRTRRFRLLAATRAVYTKEEPATPAVR